MPKTRWTYWDLKPEIVLQHQYVINVYQCVICFQCVMCYQMPWKCTNMCLLFTATNLSNSFQQHDDLSSKILRASKQHHDHHDHHIMRKHQRQLWVSSSQWPGREICETLFNKLHMAVSIYRGHVSRLNCLFCSLVRRGFSLQNRAIQVTATSPIYINLLDKNDGTTCLHNVSPQRVSTILHCCHLSFAAPTFGMLLRGARRNP